MTYCSGSAEAATKYIKSFEKEFEVKLHCVTKEKDGAKFLAEMSKYIQLVRNSLVLFDWFPHPVVHWIIPVLCPNLPSFYNRLSIFWIKWMTNPLYPFCPFSCSVKAWCNMEIYRVLKLGLFLRVLKYSKVSRVPKSSRSGQTAQKCSKAPKCLKKAKCPDECSKVLRMARRCLELPKFNKSIMKFFSGHPVVLSSITTFI